MARGQEYKLIGPSKDRPHLEPSQRPWSGCLLFGWPPHTGLQPGFPGSFSPSVSHHLAVSLRAWRVTRSWHRLSTEISWPVCWAWLWGPQLCPNLMMGEGSRCTESVLPGPTDGQPREEATWQGHAVVKCGSLGFISKMLLGWQEHTCSQQEWLHQWPWKDLGLGGLLLELDILSQTSAAPLRLRGLTENLEGMLAY